MRKKQKNIKQGRELMAVEAYAALLQKHCGMCVTAYDFYPGGRKRRGYSSNGTDASGNKNVNVNPIGAPCSLITVEPFCPNGQRRLVLNARHPLIIAIAIFTVEHRNDASASAGTTTTTTAITTAITTAKGGVIPEREIGMVMGEAMINSASWPTSGLDISSSPTKVYWKMSPSLLCGPHFGMISPVPHLEMNDGDGDDTITTTTTTKTTSCNRKALAVYPRKILYSGIKWGKGGGGGGINQHRSSSSQSEYEVITRNQGEVWNLRDKMLYDEWDHHLNNRNALKNKKRKVSNKDMLHTTTTRSKSSGLISYSPALPIILLSQLIKQNDGANTNANVNEKSISTSESSSTTSSTSSPSYTLLSTPRYQSMSAATSILLSCDKLFCLTLFFGVPLIDRTNTLKGAIKTHSLNNGAFAIPTKTTIESYRASLSLSSSTSTSKKNNAHQALEETMLQVAEDLWRGLAATSVEGGRIMVAWSGGIDSTGVLVALLRTSTISSTTATVHADTNVDQFHDNGHDPSRTSRHGDDQVQRKQRQRRLDQLIIVLDETSISENPIFYKTYIENKITTVQRNGRSLSEIAKAYDTSPCSTRSNNAPEDAFILVTGELGDQIFGSAKCEIAFPRPLPKGLSDYNRNVLQVYGDGDTTSSSTSSEKKVCLDEPWEDAMIRILLDQNLLAGGVEEWKEWIRPQLEKAPFPIVSLFDMLWWFNFSCKWQDVSLRCLHDGGNYRPNNHSMSNSNRNRKVKVSSSSRSLTGIIHHFYSDIRLQCWSCVPEFHATKFKNLHDWKTYKEPLKHFILSYDGNHEYYVHKEKVGSLCFDLNDEMMKSRARTHCGMILTSDMNDSNLEVDLDGSTCIGTFTTKPLMWGNASLRDCRPGDLVNCFPELRSAGNGGVGITSMLIDLLEPWILKQSQSTPPICLKTMHVNPWTKQNIASAPFAQAPAFAEDDERKERIYNPVTAITLVGKCSSLLDPNDVRGKTVLDLGACLGSMLHWCLFHGAEKAVGVEPQRDFCERMTKLMKGAEHTWPATTVTDMNSVSEDRFEVVCSDARKFLAECADQSYDIVIAAGVLHCFHDPINVLAEMSRVAKEYVMIESVHPAATRTGALQDYTGAFEPMNHMEFSPSAQVNVAKELASITGVAAVPTKALLENAMHAAGFETFTIQLAEHPTHNKEVAQYTATKRFHATPLRFFLRCIRQSNTARNTFQLLENVVKEDEGERTCHKSPWMGNLESWNRFQNNSNVPNPGDRSGQNTTVVAGKPQEDNSPHFMQRLTTAWNPFQVPGSAPSALIKEKQENANNTHTKEARTTFGVSEMPSSEQFITWDSADTLAHKIQFDGTQDPYPYFVSAWGSSSDSPVVDVDDGKAATFGYVYSGKAHLSREIGGSTLTMTLVGGMYFSCPGKFHMSGGSGFIATVKNNALDCRIKCSFTMGGPIEKNENDEHIGYLAYIDGCSDSILIHPTLYGYPCLNHLHFPKNVQQTRHSHPSGRAGMVFQGEGTCVIVTHKTNETIRVPLRPGMVFVIPKDAEHAFETNGSQTLDVIAFHPDSDYGPTNTNHPMVNRTIVGGVSASILPSIQTKLSFQ